MSASGPVHEGPNDQEPLEELFGAVFDLADEIASRISQDQVEARLRRTLREAGHRQEEKPARKADRQGQVSTAPHNNPSVAVLVSRVRAGDKDAWDEIVDRYSSLIWSICRRCGLDSADAEDVGQTVWQQLVDQLDSLRDPAVLPGWLAATTRRECLRVLRARGSELPQSADDVVTDEEILAAERRAALRAAFAELSPRDQRLISMLISDPPRSYGEISAELGIPVKGIGPARARCFAQMRRHPAVAALIDTEAEEPGRHSSIEAWADPAGFRRLGSA